MTNNAKERFEKSREKFANALKNLEENIFAKFDELSKNAKALDASSLNESALSTKFIEQESTIDNLSDELNKLQKTIAEIGKENEFLKEKNHFFADKIFKFKSQGSKLIQAVEDDLIKINEIIKK